jgi:hypothetical protein
MENEKGLSNFSSGPSTGPSTNSLQHFMLRVRFICLILALTLMSLSGCSQGPVTLSRVTLNRIISTKDVIFIVPGKTDISEVVEKLGTPNDILSSKAEIITRYYFTDGKYFKANYAWGLHFIIPFFTPDLELGGGGLGTDVFQVTYDEHWIVRDRAFALHSNSSDFLVWPFRD